MKKWHGYAPKISAFLLYSFWEPIYNKVDEYTPQPRERKVHCLGISHHVGDKLSCYAYFPDTKKIFSQSNIRSVAPTRRGSINKYIVNNKGIE